MPAYASAKHAYGICDRSGFRYKLEDLVYEVQHGERTGLRVGYDIGDPDQRPDTNPGRGLWGWNPVWNPAQYMVGSVGTLTVNITDGE